MKNIWSSFYSHLLSISNQQNQKLDTFPLDYFIEFKNLKHLSIKSTNKTCVLLHFTFTPPIIMQWCLGKFALITKANNCLALKTNKHIYKVIFLNLMVINQIFWEKEHRNLLSCCLSQLI